MPDFFGISGAFPIKEDVPVMDLEQVFREAQETWQLAHFDFTVEPGQPRIAKFCFEAGVTSQAFANEIVMSVEGWAERFALWSHDVLRYTLTVDQSERRHFFFGPDNRCIEAKLSSIEKRMCELEEEWADYNCTQLAKATGVCSTLLDYTEAAC